MPKRLDLRKILIIGSGPIVIGQGCEFDYSGVQACKALKAEGYEIVLVNSNPATIMTDPDMADHTYLEPINWQSLAEIIKIERPHAILSTMGGQTALNCALELETQGILKKYNVELIGANKAAIDKAEDRDQFRVAMKKIGLDMPKSLVATNMAEAHNALKQLGFPIIIRPSYTLGGSGGGIAYNAVEFEHICQHGLALSRNTQLLIEESLLGWKEYELEVIRDANDSCIIVCTIENLDPMGIHTGDSITVAPAQTLTDREYQIMRDAAIAILREIGVQTGGSNVQFALHPETGRMVVIEMNPRVSRSSALASKATGFPIAKVAALLAVGYTLDELKNDITGGVIPASFEPTIDYVVVKIPRFNFDKFPESKPQLTTQMQAVGEVMAIGATFQAALQKALSSLEIDINGFASQVGSNASNAIATITHQLRHAGPLRLLYVADAFRAGLSIEDIYRHTAIDRWFLDQIQDLIRNEQTILQTELSAVSAEQFLYWKQIGFSDPRLAELLKVHEAVIRAFRFEHNIKPRFKRIDSCAAEFPASTAYLYASYDGVCEAAVSSRQKVIVLGSGPNRIGQGIEFDYCCVQAVQALQEHNIESIMINCNPETVSTDYDISDRLYFEALTLETVMDIIDIEKPLGVILQLGGQTPLKLAANLQHYGVNILGTSPDTIDLAEDRGRFVGIIDKLRLQQPENAMVKSVAAGLQAAEFLGYPLMLRPSYVLGGRDMRVVYNEIELTVYLTKAFININSAAVLIDRFLQQAIEIDVDVIADGQGGVLIAGVMQHIEPAGVHSGDSASSLPPYNLSIDLQNKIKIQARSLALELKITGLMNIQFAVQNNEIYVLEVNPRASRTVPFVSKSIGWSVTKVAVACMLGKSLSQQNLKPINQCDFYAVKQSVFPFIKFPSADPLLGPEMRSTGEVMAFGKTFAEAYGKSLQAAGAAALKISGHVYLSVSSSDAATAVKLAQDLVLLGYELIVCEYTQTLLKRAAITAREETSEATVSNLLAAGAINLVISTAFAGVQTVSAHKIRSTAIRHKVNCVTTLSAANALLASIKFKDKTAVYKLQALHAVSKLEHAL